MASTSIDSGKLSGLNPAAGVSSAAEEGEQDSSINKEVKGEKKDGAAEEGEKDSSIKEVKAAEEGEKKSLMSEWSTSAMNSFMIAHSCKNKVDRSEEDSGDENDGGNGTVAAQKTIETVDKIVDQFENLTVFGNKSLNELHSIQSKRSHLSAGIFFTHPSLRIPHPILDSLTKEMRFEKPSEIQASTLPLILDNKSVIAQAQSGAGKTIAFAIGMLAKVDVNFRGLQALCLAPTRELVNQIVDNAIKPLSSRIPGITYEKALPGLDIYPGTVCTSHIVVGTTGTVRGLAEKGYLRMGNVRIFVLDEADKMVEDKSMGKETLAIKKLLRPDTQVLFFSATYAPEILKFAKMIVPQAFVVRPESVEELVLDVIFQIRMDVRKAPGGKLSVLQDIYELLTIQQSIVFVEMRKDVDRIAQLMTQSGFIVSTLHGELSPEDRDRVMVDFKSGRSKLLITTNALARGVDVPAVAVVVNFNLPVKRTGSKTVADAETYLHRIGRCGRFGRKGTAINFLETPGDFAILEDIEKVYSPEKRMTNEWDPTDISGLKIAIEDLPEGGEILPSATTGASSSSSITITRL